MQTLSIAQAFAGIFAFFLTLSPNLAAQCDHPDFPALEKLYTTTNGEDWTDKSGWLTDCAPCGWAGVDCDADERVTKVYLRGNGLTGELPVEIQDLDRLETLNLSNNLIGGTLPGELFGMITLRVLNVSRNRFTGQIPASIGAQTELEQLWLSENQLSGPVPAGVANLTQLRKLMLEENQLTGFLPEGLGDFPHLRTLGLTNNDLEGCFPLDLAALCGQARLLFDGNLKMAWKGDFSQLCTDAFDDAQIGAPCDDGDPDTGSDVINEDCGCHGGALDADGLVGLGEIPEENALTAGTLPGSLTGSGLNAPAGEIASAAAAYEVAVSPNPVVGNELTVRLPEGTEQSTLRLLSLTGRVLQTQASEQATTVVQLPVLEAGLYLVEVVSAGNRTVKRIMVQ